jgi:hypothetical protein
MIAHTNKLQVFWICFLKETFKIDQSGAWDCFHEIAFIPINDSILELK